MATTLGQAVIVETQEKQGAMSRLEAEVKAGATVEVRFADGLVLKPWPIHHLALVDVGAGLELRFWWIGDEEREHSHQVNQWTELEDGRHVFDVDGDTQIVIEPVWSPVEEAMLREWHRRWKTERIRCRYGDEGWTYADEG